MIDSKGLIAADGSTPMATPCNCIGPQPGYDKCPCHVRVMVEGFGPLGAAQCLTPPRGEPMPKTIEQQLEAIQVECPDSIIKHGGIYVECFIRNECLQPLLDALLMTDKLDNS